MLIFWIKRSEKDGRRRREKGGSHSFSKHDEQMKRFRASHPRIESSRPEEPRPMGLLVPLEAVQLSEFVRN